MTSSERGGAPDRGGRSGGSLYGGLPARQGPPGLEARLLELGDELRREGVAIGTSELLDAFGALAEVSWTDQEEFREALATTLAKSQDDRRVFDVLFDRFFFRAVEREAVERGLTEQRFEARGGSDVERIDFDALRDAVRAAIRTGSDGEMRDLARLSIAALGRGGEGSGVVGVDVQRIRRSLGLRGDATGDAQARCDLDSVPPERLREFERHLRRELERGAVELTRSLAPSRARPSKTSRQYIGRPPSSSADSPPRVARPAGAGARRWWMGGARCGRRSRRAESRCACASGASDPAAPSSTSCATSRRA